MYDAVVVGAGFAGSICARKLAEEYGKKVLLVEERGVIAGNMYDYYDEEGILVHKYGPHILTIDDREVFEYLTRFTEWRAYHHEVQAEIDGCVVPLPINFKSIDMLFSPLVADELKRLLKDKYVNRENVTIDEMMQCTDPKIKAFAKFVFEKVFMHYTEKMWGKSPNKLDETVLGRVPVRLSYDSRYFQKRYQYMPSDGYVTMFSKLLEHPNITLQLNTKSEDILRFDPKRKRVCLHGLDLADEQTIDLLIYTGALDRLLDYKHGELPYRTLYFEHRRCPQEHVQNAAVVNYPDCRPATRCTEMKWLTAQTVHGVTSTVTEYPHEYEHGNPIYGEPYYPIVCAENYKLYDLYAKEASEYKCLRLVGRMAEYRYYNMEEVIKRAFTLVKEIG